MTKRRRRVARVRLAGALTIALLAAITACSAHPTDPPGHPADSVSSAPDLKAIAAIVSTSEDQLDPAMLQIATCPSPPSAGADPACGPARESVVVLAGQFVHQLDVTVSAATLHLVPALSGLIHDTAAAVDDLTRAEDEFMSACTVGLTPSCDQSIRAWSAAESGLQTALTAWSDYVR